MTEFEELGGITLDGLDHDDWHRALDQIGERHGYFLTLGERHRALFLDGGPNLLVTFEDAQTLRRDREGRPLGLDLAPKLGWSYLMILAEGQTWFRDEAIYRFFDRLIDDGFMEDFDRTLFFGSYAGGYAAAAYSVSAPGAHVLMLRPVATLAADIASWDRRALSARRLDFNTRYGYAPDMLDAADRAWLIHDPVHQLDSVHASLFRKPHLDYLTAPCTGAGVLDTLERMELVPELIRRAMTGDLTRRDWARLWRARRDFPPYTRLLMERVHREGRRGLAQRVLRHGRKGPDAAFYEHWERRQDSQGGPPRRVPRSATSGLSSPRENEPA